MNRGTDTAFGGLKQVDAGLLSVGYAEAGPAGGPAVILLHGWPYDIYSYAEATPPVIEGGVGHNLPHEAPQAFAQAVIDIGGS
jgi:pimeloyl-ACP methyl ester carboxylesterase